MVSSRKRAPQLVGGAIQELLARFDTQGGLAIVRLIRAWPEAVGEVIARRTEVSGLKFGTAVIKVSGAMWLQELNLMKPQILARLRATLNDDAVRDLRFVQGLRSHRQPPRLRPVARNPRRAIALPELRDAELRSAFAGLIEAWGRCWR